MSESWMTKHGLTTKEIAQTIADKASGNERELFRLLDEAGAKVIRSYPAPAYQRAQDDRRKLLQVHVVFPDGTIGFFGPGGPKNIWNYMFVAGSTEDDREFVHHHTTGTTSGINKIIRLDPDLEEMCARYTAAQKIRNANEHDEGVAEALLGDPMYGRRVRMPKWNMEVTMLQEPKVALRYWHSWGIPTSKEAHRQRGEYFRDLAYRFSNEWDDVVERAIDLYGTTPDGKKDRLAGTLISGVYRSHFPDDVKERLRFLAYGGQMIKDAARLHEFLSKTRSPTFR